MPVVRQWHLTCIKSVLCCISQEEALLVETAMQNKMREALEEQREAADTLLEQTVKQVSC